MAADSTIFVRIDSNTKKAAESIIRDLGLTPSAVITMLYRQIIITRGIPFDVRLPVREPIDIGNLSKKEIDDLIMEGYNSSRNGENYTLEEAKKILAEDLQIDIKKV